MKKDREMHSANTYQAYMLYTRFCSKFLCCTSKQTRLSQIRPGDVVITSDQGQSPTEQPPSLKVRDAVLEGVGNVAESVLARKGSAQMRHASFLLTFYWQKNYTAYQCPPSREHRPLH